MLKHRRNTAHITALLAALVLMVGCTSPAAQEARMLPTTMLIPTHTQIPGRSEPFPVASHTFVPTVTSTPYPTLPPKEMALALVTSNTDWTPVARDFQGMTMMLVPVGCVMMGEDAIGGRQCFSEPFWIGRTEVTNAEYAQFIAVNGYSIPTYWTELGWQERQGEGWTHPSRWDDSNLNGPGQPVVGVSWFEAMAYATWRGVSLCTERQWEYAARGPDGLMYPWGNEFSATDVVYGYNSNGRSAIVGSRPSGASWVGALDMSGNVWNWTQSEWREYPYDARDGRENGLSAQSRVLRGGSWSELDNVTGTTHRTYERPVNRSSLIGFRVCAPIGAID